MRYLLIPENNSLSHITKCLSIMDLIKTEGHEAHIAITEKHSSFLNTLGIKHHILSDIQETDSGGFPSFKWFSNVETIQNCIEEEVALIKRIKPDRVLGVFRFTLHASARIAQIPYDSLICGCLLPDSNDVMGFSDNEEGIDLQRQYLNNFFRFAGAKMSLALKKFGLDKIDDIRSALKGEHTFLWDFPEFMPIHKAPNLVHVGPIHLHHWPYDMVSIDSILGLKRPLAVVSFGTCINDKATVLRIVKILLELDYSVIIAAGGQEEIRCIHPSDPRVTVLNFAPLDKIFPYTSLLVTHGGQMTVFEALQNKIPVFVMPLQPEQAHNGVCLERLGCGTRLIPSTHFTGIPDDYINAFYNMSDDEIKYRISHRIADHKTKANLTSIKEAIDSYQGARALVNYLLR